MEFTSFLASCHKTVNWKAFSKEHTMQKKTKKNETAVNFENRTKNGSFLKNQNRTEPP